MSRHTKPPSTENSVPAICTVFTLADVIIAITLRNDLFTTRRRDLNSAVNRVAELLGDKPVAIPLDIPVIGAKLAKVSPVAAGMSVKTFANVRANFMAAIKAGGLLPSAPAVKSALSLAWSELTAKLPEQRWKIGVSSLSRFASAAGILPDQIDDQAIERFIASVRSDSLHRKPNDLHRQTTKVWNEIALRMPELGLGQVTVPSFRPPTQRVAGALLADSFHKDVEAHLDWCEGNDVFAADARTRPLSVRSIALRRDQIHAAVTALVASGSAASSIKSLSDLVTPDAFKSILRHRHAAADGKPNSFNTYLAMALISIAREWVKAEDTVIIALKKMMSKQPKLASGLTAKNKSFLRQFDDPKAFVRLVKLPLTLWAEVKRESKPNFRTLAKAQAALAIAIEIYMPIRLQNLASLAFATHLFLKDDVRAISTLELPAEEVKNDLAMGFDIPPFLAKMLIEYRDHIAPKVIGRRPERLFVNVDGSPKCQETVAWLISTNVYRRAGLVLTVHQFRHLAAKVMLDADPGNFEAVKQDLGHKSLKTTAGFYTGIDSRRAARHHQRLIDKALEDQKKPRKPSGQRKPKKSAEGQDK
jgi:integrase